MSEVLPRLIRYLLSAVKIATEVFSTSVHSRKKKTKKTDKISSETLSLRIFVIFSTFICFANFPSRRKENGFFTYIKLGILPSDSV